MTRMIYPTTNPRATEQLVITRGEGVYVYDNTGKQYIEGLSGLWCTALGYGNEEVVEAATRQMRELTYCHLFGGKTHPAAMRLADQIAEMVPVEDARVFLGNSGSDANDSLVKLIRYHAAATGRPERCRIIARDRGYHGVTLASAALTGLPAMHTHFNLPFEALGVLRVGSPHFYRDGLPGETEEEFASRRAQELEDLILEQGPETIAAFIAEPVGGAGGVIVPPPTYYARIQEILRRYDILFWDDEVITGFGRLGTDFGATALDLQPQFMTLAKALSSAYMPISAAVVPGDWADALLEPAAEMGVFGHGYTYGGHPVSCAVASKVLEIYARDRLFEHAASVGEHLQAALASLSEHPLVGEARGMGLIGALELVACKRTRQAFAGNAIGAFCQRAAEEEGLIVRALAGNAIALCPPLIITREQIDDLVARLTRALDATLDHAKRESLLVA